MGYHLSIRREKSVSLEEFRAASEQTGAGGFTNDDKTAEFKTGSGTLFVYWKDGEVWTINPEEEAIGTLYRLSAKLQGRLVGDEGETYREDGSSFIAPEDEDEHRQWQKESSKRIRNRTIWSVVRISVILIVLTILILNKCVLAK